MRYIWLYLIDNGRVRLLRKGRGTFVLRQGNRQENLRLANKIFNNIDKKREGRITEENLSAYFT